MSDAGPADYLSARLAAVDAVLADPPRVHYMSVEDLDAGHQTGVWSTERSCYEFLAGCCPEGATTLETGAGLSTVLFTAWRTRHLCVTPGQEEADAVVRYCLERGIGTERVSFDIRTSDVALPSLQATPLDTVFIDGGHGFPMPMLDWYFAAGRLRKGGMVVIDDLQLPAVAVLAQFLEADPRWQRRGGTDKWVAFERLEEGGLLEDWYMQPFYAGPRPVTALAHLEARLQARLGGLRRRLGAARSRLRPQP